MIQSLRQRQIEGFLKDLQSVQIVIDKNSQKDRMIEKKELAQRRILEFEIYRQSERYKDIKIMNVLLERETDRQKERRIQRYKDSVCYDV